ncbi:cyclin-like protein [Hygrophoropsis aurantiaca]|uniref:Cyclin-like protein n=1 Tax=Hygrophoropsis aurantiaca TaxID=72124 RepID=A0ACB8A1L6_9AGAM|nr:cyclin-like protein [Hygrophoropsis aurantiaca]
MATDFWVSSHYKRWIIDRATLRQARVDDLQYVEDPEFLDFFSIFFANVIAKLGKKLNLRQRVIASATVFFRRFYLKNSYCETDPFIVIAACCYVAAKTEESPIHIKNMVAEARLFFSQTPYCVKSFPSDNSKLAEMEFYLVDDLECDLTIFHPYRTLLSLVRKEDSSEFQAEAGELSLGIDDGIRYWGTGDGQLELPDGALQLAWSIVNDTYRSDLCLIYPPHLLAVTALYLTLVLHAPTRDMIQQHPQSALRQGQAQSLDQQISPRRSSRQASHSSGTGKKPAPDIVGFFADLNVSMPLVASVAQEIISLYTLWDRYKEDSPPENTSRTSVQSQAAQVGSPFSSATHVSHSGSHSGVGTPVTGIPDVANDVPKVGTTGVVTPMILMQVLTRMRENRLSDLSHPASGRPVAVNKMLERTQAAG